MTPEKLKERLKNAGLVPEIIEHEPPVIDYDDRYYEESGGWFGTFLFVMFAIVVISIIVKVSTTDRYFSTTCHDFDGNIVFQMKDTTNIPYEKLENNKILLPNNKVITATCDWEDYRK